uniref:Uncharacterized protein n=1 Tax=Arion vulgaris TaxID=1028688 RepID=A0A0B7BP93_9EUPU
MLESYIVCVCGNDCIQMTHKKKMENELHCVCVCEWLNARQVTFLFISLENEGEFYFVCVCEEMASFRVMVTRHRTYCEINMRILKPWKT